MGKQRKWTLEEKEKIVKEFRNGATISYLMKKYNISGFGTVSRWNQEFEKGTLGQNNRGRRKQKIEEIDILKKSYALLIKIRNEQHK
jgi:hypothetical protein